jgi:hypothetical protein
MTDSRKLHISRLWDEALNELLLILEEHEARIKTLEENYQEAAS